MAEITGKDFCFSIPDADLVRIAMRQLRDEQIPITLQSVAERSGLTIPQVKRVVLQAQSEQGKRK